MIYGFNDDKTKVDVEAILAGLESTYQSNVNTIYNAVVNNGVTPTAKTPAAIATGINGIRSGGNAAAADILAGKNAYVSKSLISGSMANYSGSNRRTVTPTGGTGNEQLSLSAGYHNSVIVNRTAPYNAGKAAAEAVTWTETKEYYVDNDSMDQYKTLSLVIEIPARNLVSIKNESSSRTLKFLYNTSGQKDLAPKATWTLPTSCSNLECHVTATVEALTSLGVNLTFTYQAKLLR